MFTIKEAMLCKQIIDKKLKKLRKKHDEKNNAKELDSDSELMVLVSIYNKLNERIESQNDSMSSLVDTKILVVDDIQEIRDTVTDMLTKMGFEKVDAANSAEKAWRLLNDAADSDKPYKLVLTDSDMSGKSGITLLKEIRQSEKLSSADVFIMSANSEHDEIVNAMEAGVTGYILKPLSFNTLQEKLEKYLPSDE
ncbi:response regulator [Alteromonas sp. A081]|uniref:response regulator n=1 Tax=Alteromonas sp. A081 TaxID=3410269 RepID=UPI003B9864C4